MADEGLHLFLNYLFDAFPFRRLYFETPDFNSSEFRWFMHTHVIEEGRLSEAVFFDGRYWDLLHNTLTRQGWEAFRESNVGRLVAAGLFRAPDGADSAPGVRAEGETLVGPAAESF